MSTHSNFPPQRPNVRDMIHRFRYGKPTSRGERGTGIFESGSNWGTSAFFRDAPTVARVPPRPPTLSDILDPLFDESELKSTPAGVAATAPEHLHEFDRLKWAHAIPASLQPTPGSEPVFSLPEVLLLHKSLEVEPVTAPPALASGPTDALKPETVSESPLPPDTEETLDQMIENLDVTLTRLNWRLNAMRRSAPAVIDTSEAKSEEVAKPRDAQPVQGSGKPVDSSLLDSFFLSDDEADHAPKPMPRSVIDRLPVAPIPVVPTFVSSSEAVASILGSPPQPSLSSCTLEHATIPPVGNSPVAAVVPSNSTVAASTESVVSVGVAGPTTVTATSTEQAITPNDAEWLALQDRQRQILERLSGIHPPPIPPPDRPVVFPYIAPEASGPPVVLSSDSVKLSPAVAPPAAVVVSPVLPAYTPRQPPRLPTQTQSVSSPSSLQPATPDAQRVMSQLMSFQAARAAVASRFGV